MAKKKKTPAKKETLLQARRRLMAVASRQLQTHRKGKNRKQRQKEGLAKRMADKMITHFLLAGVPPTEDEVRAFIDDVMAA